MCKFLHEHILLIILHLFSEVELLAHMLIIFNILRNCQIVYQSGYTILLFYQQCMKVLIFFTSSPILVTVHFFYYGHLNIHEVILQF